MEQTAASHLHQCLLPLFHPSPPSLSPYLQFGISHQALCPCTALSLSGFSPPKPSSASRPKVLPPIRLISGSESLSHSRFNINPVFLDCFHDKLVQNGTVTEQQQTRTSAAWKFGLVFFPVNKNNKVTARELPPDGRCHTLLVCGRLDTNSRSPLDGEAGVTLMRRDGAWRPPAGR